MPIGTLWASRPPWDLKRTFSICMLFSIVILAMTACDQNSVPQTSANPLSDPRSQATSASADGRFSVDTPSSLRGESNKPKGPFSDISPLEIKQGGSLGSLGLNLDTYFAGNIGDTNARIDRLEGAVTSMHRDLKILAPSMQRLALIEGDLQDLVAQLEAMLQEDSGVTAAPMPAYTPPTPIAAPVTIKPNPAAQTPAPASVQSAPQSLSPEESDMIDELANSDAAPTPAPVTTPLQAPSAAQPAPTAVAPAPAPVAGSPRIVGIRFGGDNGKTRIVFDADQPVTYTKDLDNAEKLLVIELPKAAWGAAAQGTAPKSSAVDTWTSQANGSGGTRVILTLKKAVSVSYEGVMKPEPGTPHHRVVIDLQGN